MILITTSGMKLLLSTRSDVTAGMNLSVWMFDVNEFSQNFQEMLLMINVKRPFGDVLDSGEKHFVRRSSERKSLCYFVLLRNSEYNAGTRCFVNKMGLVTHH